MKIILFTVLILSFQYASTQTCYTISNRTNGNGFPGTCGSPNCSVSAKTGHIDVNFGASCPCIIPKLQLISVSSGPLPSPFCFDPGNCVSPGSVRYCFRGSNLPNSGFMVLQLTQGASVWSCNYDVNGGAGTVLPVTFSKFIVKTHQDGKLLHWRTETELNNKVFEIERSNDMQNYNVIATVDGQGNSSIPIDYEYLDKNPLKGQNYYRIKQVDFDGKYSYSVIRRADHIIEGVQIHSVFPNPAHQQVTLEIFSERLAQTTIAVYNSLGVEVQRQSKRLNRGWQNVPLNLSNHPGGLYKIVLDIENSGVIVKKILLQ
jgi:hypothetical protein